MIKRKRSLQILWVVLYFTAISTLTYSLYQLVLTANLMTHLTESQREEIIGFIFFYGLYAYPTDIKDITELTDDLGYDSLDRFFLWEDLKVWLKSQGRPKEELIPEQEISTWTTVKDVIYSVETRLP